MKKGFVHGRYGGEMLMAVTLWGLLRISLAVSFICLLFFLSWAAGYSFVDEVRKEA